MICPSKTSIVCGYTKPTSRTYPILWLQRFVETLLLAWVHLYPVRRDQGHEAESESKRLDEASWGDHFGYDVDRRGVTLLRPAGTSRSCNAISESLSRRCGLYELVELDVFQHKSSPIGANNHRPSGLGVRVEREAKTAGTLPRACGFSTTNPGQSILCQFFHFVIL